MADEFQVVRNKKGRKIHYTAIDITSNSQANSENEYFTLDNFMKRLNNCIQEIYLSEFFKSSYDAVLFALSDISEKKKSCNSQKNAIKKTEFSLDARSDGGCQTTDQRNRPEQSTVRETEDASQDLPEAIQSLNLTELHLLSYGIGNFASCVVARYQLAFLLALKEKLKDKCTNCSVYDPVFTSQEQLVLQKYDCHVISENEEGKKECTVPTVAFLPHCGKALYNNLLWRNLGTPNGRGLTHLILLGNSFTCMIERTPERILRKTGNYILKLSPYATEIQLTNAFPRQDVFNDLAIHTFSSSQVSNVLQHMGDNLQEPVYENDDAEFIMK